MLQIRRKLFAIPINQVYFQELKYESRYEPEIIYYSHVLKPSRKLQGQKTLHVDLSQKGAAFYKLSSKVIDVLDDSQVENWTISRVEQPTDKEIEEFLQIYNLNARHKNARRLNNFDLQTLQLLRDQGGLVMTKIENKQKEAICYRIYVVGEGMVMAIYNDEQEFSNDSMKQKANYLLCWGNMKHFGKRGYRIYDFGDFKDLTLLEELKANFGGQLVTVFSGYISKSFFSQMLLQVNLKRLKKRLSL